MYEKLKKLLQERGETVADMCRATGVPETTMSNLKRRGGNLSALNLVKVAHYLGVSVESLVEE